MLPLLFMVDNDIDAVEFVRTNGNSFIATVFPLVGNEYDGQIYDMFNSYGQVVYRKVIQNITLNGVVNLKLVHYSGLDGHEQWVGNELNGFSGAYEHACESMNGNGNLRIYVLTFPSIKYAVECKQRIRDTIGLGNWSIHITDSHQAAIQQACIYFNDLTIDELNNIDFIQNKFAS